MKLESVDKHLKELLKNPKFKKAYEKEKKVTEKFIRKIEETPEIIFVIHPTRFEDYDILALGSEKALKKLCKKDPKWFHYIDSPYGKLVVCDTCDMLDDAESLVGELIKDFSK